MLKKKDLISLVQETRVFENPKVELEQYCIDAGSVVDIAYFAGIEHDDIRNKLVIDLGTGTGRISIASAFIGAHAVIGVDIDRNALIIFKKNIDKLALGDVVFPICANVHQFEFSRIFLSYHSEITTIMNPPFGVKKKKADRAFLATAFSFSNIVYSIHLTGKKTHDFISNYAIKKGWIVDYYIPFNMLLERAFLFHKYKSKKIDVQLYRFVKKRKK
ncbi:MAG: METTL5 family protein [Promethearchaeota archaeon]